jgi:hypothetical protein
MNIRSSGLINSKSKVNDNFQLAMSRFWNRMTTDIPVRSASPHNFTLIMAEL